MFIEKPALNGNIEITANGVDITREILAMENTPEYTVMFNDGYCGMGVVSLETNDFLEAMIDFKNCEINEHCTAVQVVQRGKDNPLISK